MNNLLPYPELNDEEQQLAERLWMVYDMFCRIHNRIDAPDWYYVWDKANSLSRCAAALHNQYRENVMAPGYSDGYTTTFVSPQRVDVDKVIAWLGYKLRRNHPGVGERLFPKRALPARGDDGFGVRFVERLYFRRELVEWDDRPVLGVDAGLPDRPRIVDVLQRHRFTLHQRQQHV